MRSSKGSPGRSFRSWTWRRARVPAGSGSARIASSTSRLARGTGISSPTPSRSARPTTSDKDRRPSDARIARTSSAIVRKKLITRSGVPGNFARRSGRWVAMPTGQVLRWHCLAITHPSATTAALPNPNSSAPSIAAITTSRAHFMPPSTRTRTRPRRLFATSVCWVSASPSSHGTPAFLIESRGEAPVPPSHPAMWTVSA